MAADSFPVVNTDAGPCHTFRNLVKPVAPPFRFEIVPADVQEFDPERLMRETVVAPDLFNWAKSETNNA